MYIFYYWFSVCFYAISVNIAFLDCCNQFLFAYFDIFLDSMNCCTDAIFNTWMYSALFFSWLRNSMSSLECKVWCLVIDLLVLLSSCPSFFLVLLKKSLEYLKKGRPRYLFFWLYFCGRVWFREVFFWGTLFSFRRFPYKHDIFFYFIFHSYILAVSIHNRMTNVFM